MQVRVGSSLSDYYDQEQGVPQGGVLSTTLFSIKINDIVKCLGGLTDCSLYVDDFCICYRSKSMATTYFAISTLSILWPILGNANESVLVTKFTFCYSVYKRYDTSGFGTS